MKTKTEREIMDIVINELNSDKENGLARFLQANPYTRFPFYTYDDIITPESFENLFYCESVNSNLYKNYLCKIIDNPHGKNTFFIVGYQGCGKTTFIHSVINKYSANNRMQTIEIDCDKRGIGKGSSKLKKIFSLKLQEELLQVNDFSHFIDFFTANFKIINQFSNKKELIGFYRYLDKVNKQNCFNEIDFSLSIDKYINDNLDCEDIVYILLFLALSMSYNNVDKIDDKIILIVDNLDYVDAYNDLLVFINALDAFTIDFSDKFSKLKLCRDSEKRIQYTDKIKLFIAMRETTRASLPTSHFSDAFQTIYKSNDITEWYDKSNIIRKRIDTLKRYDKKNLLNPQVSKQLNLLLKITEDSYTKNVIYPLFNNNYRSMIGMISKIVVECFETLKIYESIMNIPDTTFRHGARGILFKLIFDELNKNDGNDESCFKKIGVLDLLNRKNNDVSICRLLLSYLSNYTETKCDSARNSIKLSDLLRDFKGIFKRDDILSSLCSMFELRDTKWTHLVSFNQIEYKKKNSINDLGKIEFKTLDPEKTMIHYSCAGKIYVEYVTTHFEFFTARIFDDTVDSLFCESNIKKAFSTSEYKFIEIIEKVYEEIVQCCNSLYEFNQKVCEQNNFSNPYNDAELYKKSHYICQFKRINFDDLEERRFKQYHEDRMINSHIVYLDKFRLYVLNYFPNIKDEEEKIKINKKLVDCIKKYCTLLKTSKILVTDNTKNRLIPHYDERIEELENNPADFRTEISYNN